MMREEMKELVREYENPGEAPPLMAPLASGGGWSREYIVGTVDDLSQLKQGMSDFYEGLNDTQKSFFPAEERLGEYGSSSYSRSHIEDGYVVVTSGGGGMMGIMPLSVEMALSRDHSKHTFDGNMQRFRDSLSPEQLEQWKTLKSRFDKFEEPLIKPDDHIPSAPDVTEEDPKYGGFFDGTFTDFSTKSDTVFQHEFTEEPALTGMPEDSAGILGRTGEIAGARDYLRDLDSNEVKAMQRIFGIKDDGMWGQKTMDAAQKYFQENDLPAGVSFSELQDHMREKIATHYAKSAAVVEGGNLANSFSDVRGRLFGAPSFTPELEGLNDRGYDNFSPV